MTTMVVHMECTPQFRGEVERHLREDVVVWAREQDGFRSGSWHMRPDGGAALGIVVFDSPEAAERAAAGPRGYHDPDVPFRIVGVDLFEQVAAAGDDRALA